jgi:hypothetical protein
MVTTEPSEKKDNLLDEFDMVNTVESGKESATKLHLTQT